MDIKTVNILRGTEFLEINLRDFKELFENLLKKAENGEEVVAMKRKYQDSADGEFYQLHTQV
jgi:hypothetical protein